MKSNYKPIGNYIKRVEHRNNNLNVTRLLGLSMNKEFRETTSNIVGTDMSVYRVMSKYQFACDFMSPIRVNKLPVVLKLDDEPNLVSPAYPVFEIKDRNELDPEYLMMWFRRTEFDRYAAFKCDAAIRGGYEWNELCETLIPVPSITKQKYIVKEYNVIQNRIALNEQLIQKLEETTEAIYKQWFIDYEFPNEKEKSYKSSGGLMIWNEEMQKEIPSEWEVDELRKIVLFKNGKTKPTKKGSIPVYGGNGIIEYVDKNNDENVIAIGRVGAYCGSLFRVLGKCWISDNAISAQSKNRNNMFTYYVLKDLKLNERSEGTGQPLITQNLLNNIRVIIPERDVIDNFEKIAFTIFKYQDILNLENEKLNEMKNLLLSKLATL
jgi:type I restriction enzyme S subunit